MRYENKIKDGISKMNPLEILDATSMPVTPATGMNKLGEK